MVEVRLAHPAVRRSAQAAVCVEAGGGDAVLIAHEDPVALAQTARQLIDEVFRAPGQPRLRVALHYGDVHVRQRPGERDKHGHLVHRPGGGWAFHYEDGESSVPDDVGYHFADERFMVGEYVSLNEGGKMHTYRVTTVSYL